MTNEETTNNGPEAITLNRLRATRTQYESGLKQFGSNVGETFVMVTSDYGHLRRLQRWVAEVGCEQENPSTFQGVAKIMSNADGSEKDLEKDMRKECGSDIDEPEWIAGFIEGALAKFEELEPKL